MIVKLDMKKYCPTCIESHSIRMVSLLKNKWTCTNCNKAFIVKLDKKIIASYFVLLLFISMIISQLLIYFHLENFYFLYLILVFLVSILVAAKTGKLKSE